VEASKQTLLGDVLDLPASRVNQDLFILAFNPASRHRYSTIDDSFIDHSSKVRRHIIVL
jgi:hypothetical protein